MSYPVNYLISRLQNSSRNMLFENQTNLFAIIDQSNGLILDTTVDCQFLSLLSSIVGNYSINGNNQISLTSLQVQQYIGLRMYYYNPAVLATIIFAISSYYFSVDLNAGRYNLYLDANFFASRMLGDWRQSYEAPYFSATGTASNTYPSVKIVNNYAFRTLYLANASVGYALNFPRGFTFPAVNQPRSFAFCLYCPDSATRFALYTHYNGSTGAYLDISYIKNGTSLTVYVAGSDGVNPAWEESFNTVVFSTNPVAFVVTINSSLVEYFDINSLYASHSVSDIGSSNVGSIYLFKNYSVARNGYGHFMDFIYFSDVVSQGTMSQIIQYFRTKYYVLN